jgi:hypothetical protein
LIDCRTDESLIPHRASLIAEHGAEHGIVE